MTAGTKHVPRTKYFRETGRSVEKDILPSGFQRGMILMWSGTIASIPTGWLICDGNNGTPNLLAKFVRGVATAATNPGSTGGSDTHGHSGGAGDPTSTTFVDQDLLTNQTLVATGTHSHNITVSSGSTLPAYYSVAFIMKS